MLCIKHRLDGCLCTCNILKPEPSKTLHCDDNDQCSGFNIVADLCTYSVCHRAVILHLHCTLTLTGELRQQLSAHDSLKKEKKTKNRAPANNLPYMYMTRAHRLNTQLLVCELCRVLHMKGGGSSDRSLVRASGEAVCGGFILGFSAGCYLGMNTVLVTLLLCLHKWVVDNRQGWRERESDI